MSLTQWSRKEFRLDTKGKMEMRDSTRIETSVRRLIHACSLTCVQFGTARSAPSSAACGEARTSLQISETFCS